MWFIPVALLILVGYGVVPILNKRIAGAPSRARSLLVQHAFAALFADCICIAMGASIETMFFAVAIVGVLNAFGNYAYWRAIDTSLSTTSLFSQADDLIALALGYIVLHEFAIVGVWLGIGVGILVCAAALFSVEQALKQKRGNPKSIIRWIVAYSLIWGVAMFSGRYFALEGVSIVTYLAGWYTGSLVGALTVFALAPAKERGQSLSWAHYASVAVLAVVIMISNALGYWAKMLAPITVVQPLFQLAEMILPTMIGLWYFKERQHLTRREKVALAIGLIGGMIIVYSYSIAPRTS